MAKQPITKEIARQQARAILLYLKEVAKDKGITDTRIAELSGLNRPNVSRAFGVINNDYMPELDTVLRITYALDIKLFFEDTQTDSQTDHAKLFEQAMEALGRRPDKLPKN